MHSPVVLAVALTRRLGLGRRAAAFEVGIVEFFLVRSEDVRDVASHDGERRIVEGSVGRAAGGGEEEPEAARERHGQANNDDNNY